MLSEGNRKKVKKIFFSEKPKYKTKKLNYLHPLRYKISACVDLNIFVNVVDLQDSHVRKNRLNSVEWYL